MMILGWILFAFGVIRLAVSLVNWSSRPYLPARTTRYVEQPEVSVLIPARNEEQNIGRLLDDLSLERTGIAEILVYDDNSTDRTAEIVEAAAKQNKSIRLLRGVELPDGWLGKNHACHRLAAAAKGGYLLFLDADVRIRRQAVAVALRCSKRLGVKLLSIFPHQLMPDRGTRLAVPLMNWVLLTLLPLIAVRKAPMPSLSAANGQFMFFEAETYRKLMPHFTLRTSAVEDIEIAKYYKRKGMPVSVLLGRRDVECVMYRSLKDAVEGFSKNFFNFFGGSQVLCFLFAITTTTAPVIIFIFNGIAAGLIYVFVVVVIRWLVSSASLQSPLYNILHMIPQQFMLWRIICNASARKRKKNLQWKGRNIYSQS